MLERSLEHYGAARSIVIDEQGEIIAGHGVVEAAGNVGIEKVKLVEADGNEVVAVVRRGLTTEQKAGLAVADNRASELAEWDLEALTSLDVDLDDFFTPGELKFLEEEGAKSKPLNTQPPPSMVWILLGVNVNAFGKVREALKTLEGKSDIVVKTSRDGNDEENG